MTVTILYFAQIKEALGMAQEVVQLPDDIRQVHQLLTWLCKRHDSYAAAFARCSCVRAAINERHAAPDSIIPPAATIALFPPVTGG